MKTETKQESLSLAKSSILESFWKLSLANYSPKSDELKKVWAAFVTLKKWKTKRWELRWCIWSLIATRPLYEDIIINAKNAAFSDPRFNPLQEDELDDLYVEISVLTPPWKVSFENIQELLKTLKEKKPWMIVELYWRQATFLPSVWEELPDEEQFLVHLLYKAWIYPQEFIENFNAANIYFYSSEEFWNTWENIPILELN